MIVIMIIAMIVMTVMVMIMINNMKMFHLAEHVDENAGDKDQSIIIMIVTMKMMMIMMIMMIASYTNDDDRIVCVTIYDACQKWGQTNGRKAEF